MENSRKVLTSFVGMTKPTMVKEGNSYKCTLCKKTGDYASLVPHIQTHSRNVLTYKGVQIYRCGLNCKDAPHHHCCFCNKSIILKQVFVRHLKRCEESQLTTSASSPGVSSKPQIVVQTISGASLLQALTTPVKLQGTAAPLILQTTPLSLQTSSGPALPSSRTTAATASSAKQTSTDASSSEEDLAATSSQDETPKTTSAPLQSPATAPQHQADESLQQQSLSQSETTASPLSPLESTTTPPWQRTTVTVSSAEQTPRATPCEQQTSLSDSTPSTSDSMHSSTPSSPHLLAVTGMSMPPPPEMIPPLSPSECSSPAEPKEQRPRIKCPHCSMHLFQRNLKVHISRHHKDVIADAKVRSQFRSVYVDAKNGILAVQRHTHGFMAPVHVQREAHGEQALRCDLKACQQYQQMSQRHGLTVSHCQHTRYLDHRAKTASEEPLGVRALDEMVALKLLTEPKRAMCLRRQKMAQVAKLPFSVLVDLDGSPRRMFVSIHEPRTNDFSCLGRVMVSYDTDKNVWMCPCTKAHMSCLHKNIAKWHLFQTNRSLFKTSVSSARDKSGSWNMEYTNGSSTYSLNSDIKRSVDYIYEHKKIPADLPEELTSTVLEFPAQLFPSETTCGLCPNSPSLEDAENVTYQGKIVTMMGVADYVSTYIRRCPDCHMLYRYQEWQDGLHNFNNHLLLSIELCLYFRHSLQNNIPMTRAVKTLESLRKIQYPPTETLLNAYSHFEAMMSLDDRDPTAEYERSSNPSVVTDLHRKAFLVLHWS